MNDDQYLQHCRQLLNRFAEDFSTRCRDLSEADSLRQLADAFSRLDRGEDDLYTEGPHLVARLFTTYPDFAPLFPRELLWFLGGECLHYMPDEEIAVHQQLEELRTEAAARGEVIDFQAARAKLLNLQ